MSIFHTKLKSKDTFAHAAETIARRLCLRPEPFYEWANRHSVDLIGKGHLIIQKHPETLESFLNDTNILI